MDIYYYPISILLLCNLLLLSSGSGLNKGRSLEVSQTIVNTQRELENYSIPGQGHGHIVTKQISVLNGNLFLNGTFKEYQQNAISTHPSDSDLPDIAVTFLRVALSIQHVIYLLTYPEHISQKLFSQIILRQLQMVLYRLQRNLNKIWSERFTYCQDVRKQNDSEKCHFTHTTDDCNIDEGHINYIQFVYCSFSPKLLPLAMLILMLWWFLLFIALAVAADDFFCPSLVVIAKTLRMSDNIAGVTLLAFGNGAPDVFSAIAAIGGMKNGDAGLALGALIGAGIFVTTVVAGSVAVVTPFHAMERPFLRDIIFYLAALFMTFYVLYSNVIQLYQAACFIGLYVLYVIVVVVGRYIYRRNKTARERKSLCDRQGESPQSPGMYGALDAPTFTNPTRAIQSLIENTENVGVSSTLGNEDLQSRLLHNEPDEGMQQDGTAERVPTELTSLLGSAGSHSRYPTPLREFLYAVCPIDIEGWSELKWFMKVYEIIKVVPQLIFNITVPVVDYTEPKHKWNRHLNCLHCIIAPLTALFCARYQAALYMLNDVFPVWALVLLVGIVLALVVFLTSKNEEQPKYHWVFAYIGFITAVLWIATIANEIVNILQVIGIVFNISNAILGLTFLAWGNSLGDLVADTTMARQGFPRTGISACFGGPLFNLLLGIGIPFTIKTMGSGPVQLDFTVIQVHLLVSLAVSLLSSLVILPLIKFRIGRRYGVFLYFLYIKFIIIAILIEAGVIKGHL